MRLITGDECGLLKECIPEADGANKTKADASINSNKQPAVIGTTVTVDQGIRRVNNGDRMTRRRGVMALAWTEKHQDKQFASLYMDGTLDLWERSVFSTTDVYGGYRSVRNVVNVFGNSGMEDHSVPLDPMCRPLGLSTFQKDDGSLLLCAGNMQANVVVIHPDEGKVLSSFSVFNNNNTKSLIEYPLASAMSVNSQQAQVAVGGKDRDTVLYDLHTQKQLWKAKNLAPDAQTLLQPLVWPTAIHFMPDSSLLAVGTAHKEVRVYDLRCIEQQRRPILITPYGLMEHRVTAMTSFDAHRLIVGDAAGFIHTVDVRQLNKPDRIARKSIHDTVGSHGRFVGPAGSVQQIVAHSDKSCLAVVGLDRMLRVYDSEKRKELACMYLKQRLKCVLVGQDPCTLTASLQDAVPTTTWDNDEDIDQEDVVDDYVDSEQESGVDSDQGDDDDDDDDDGPQLDGSEHSQSEDGDNSQDNSHESDDEEEEETLHSKKKRKQ